jgi:predicted secreted protein
MPAKRTLGTTISKGGVNIGSLTKISSPEKSTDNIEITTLDVTDGYKRFMPGLKDGGEVSVSGYFDSADAGQLALDTAFEAGSEDTYIINFPASIGATFTFNAIITKFNAGEANLEDPLSFELTLKVTGKPTLAVTASAGITALALSGGGTLTPTVAAGVLSYAYVFTTATSITVTATAANHTLKLYVDDVYVQDLTSGSASGSIAGFTAQSSKKITILAFEAGKSPKVYNISATRTT